MKDCFVSDWFLVRVDLILAICSSSSAILIRSIKNIHIFRTCISEIFKCHLPAMSLHYDLWMTNRFFQTH